MTSVLSYSGNQKTMEYKENIITILTCILMFLQNKY